MNQTHKKPSRAERKKLFARIVCLALAVALIGSAVLAVIIGQVF